MISNATPLICLAKLNQLELLRKLFNKIIITHDVMEEVLIPGMPGYSIINKGIEDGWIVMEDPKVNPDLSIGKGENSSINLAKEKKDTIIIDDSYAIKIIRSLNISYIRTTTIILILLKKKIINKSFAKNLFLKLVEDGYYISPRIFYILLKKIDEM